MHDDVVVENPHEIDAALEREGDADVVAAGKAEIDADIDEGDALLEAALAHPTPDVLERAVGRAVIADHDNVGNAFCVQDAREALECIAPAVPIQNDGGYRALLRLHREGLPQPGFIAGGRMPTACRRYFSHPSHLPRPTSRWEFRSATSFRESIPAQIRVAAAGWRRKLPSPSWCQRTPTRSS